MKLLFVVSGLILVSIGNANAISIGNLYKWCNSDELTTNDVLCNAWFSGYYGGAVTALNGDPNAPFYNCIPNKENLPQLRQMFQNWAKDNPKHWQAGAAFGVAKALDENYHCVKGGVEIPD